MQLTMFDLFDEMLQQSSSGKTCQEFSTPKTMLSVAFLERLPAKLSRSDRQGGGGESKWSNAGCVFGPQRTVAWRVLDAQYFGVAQRRRRVFVVASARDDFNPAEVLFEFEGLRRDIAPSRKTGQEVAGTIAARFGISRNNHEECVAMATWPLEVAPTLTADFGDKLGQNNQHIDSQKGGMFVQSQVFENHPADSRVKEMGEVCSTVVSRWGTGGGNLPMVSQPIAFEPGKMKRLGYGDAEPGLAPSLRAQAGDNQLAVAFNIAPGKGELKDDIHVTDAHVSKTIDASGSNPAMHQGGAAIVQKAYSIREDAKANTFSATPLEVSTCVGSLVPSVQSHHAQTFVANPMAVRRLTPTECERLQGFPDGYTNIPWRKAAESPDGPRYKALGNSWAVPVVRWIGQRIQERITT
jgi:DNA (cytosine-5)-methyltransferase 1